MGLKPLVFVAMPFGRKTDPSGTTEIDFDDLYNRAFVPATKLASLDVIRADEERMGGFIHAPMYERLLLAEIVIADLTLANPNVFYELGIRHAARPRSTIMVFNEGAVLPFDVRPLRAIPYRLNEAGKLSAEEAENLRDVLATKLAQAIEDDGVDSPIFQLIPGFPGINLPPGMTETFRHRVLYIDAKRMEIDRARTESDHNNGLLMLAGIEAGLKPFATAAPELLLALLLAFRDLRGWTNMITLVEQLPGPVKEHRTVQERLGLALNRRNSPGDREAAIRVLEGVIKIHGPSSETCGLLGRVYKDLYAEAIVHERRLPAEGYLDEAIRLYRLGFDSDPRDYYPGINAAVLLYEKGGDEAQKELDALLPVIEFAVGRRGGLNSRDYWDVATTLQVAVLGQNWALANRSAARFIALATHAWVVETTVKDLQRLEQVSASRGNDTTPLKELIRELSDRIGQLP